MEVYMFQYIWWFFVCREVLNTRVRIFPQKAISGRALCVILFFTYIALVAMLRSRTIGTDTWSYSRGFMYIASADSLNDVIGGKVEKSPVYSMIQYFISRISSNPQIYIATFSFIIALGFGIYIYKASTDVCFSCFLYFGMGHLFGSMNVMKQYTATAIVINAYLYLRNNIMSLKGWLLYIIALGIHSSCVFFLPAIFFSRMAEKTSVKKMTLIAGLSAVVVGYLIAYGIDLFSSIFAAYEQYGGSEGVFTRKQTGGRILLYYFFLLGYTVLYALRAWRKKTSDKDYPNVVFGMIIATLFSRNELINRIVLYYQIPCLIFIPAVCSMYPKGERRLLYCLCFIALFIYSTWNLLENKGAVVPYRLFFM